MIWYLATFQEFATEEAWGSREHAVDATLAKAAAKDRYEERLEGLVESEPEGATDNGDYSCVVVVEGA
jgi:hypothetical protein